MALYPMEGVMWQRSWLGQYIISRKIVGFKEKKTASHARNGHIHLSSIYFLMIMTIFWDSVPHFYADWCFWRNAAPPWSRLKRRAQSGAWFLLVVCLVYPLTLKKGALLLENVSEILPDYMAPNLRVQYFSNSPTKEWAQVSLQFIHTDGLFY
jgi:hypothetical protein